MKIPLFRPAGSCEPEATRLAEALTAVLRSGVYVLGPQVRAFETRLSGLLDGRETVAVGSGSDALLLAFKSLGIGSTGGGEAFDEVLLPSYTFVACAEAVIAAGARPVFVDSAPSDFPPALADFCNARTPRTRALLAVGLFGDASGLPELAAYCRNENLLLVEDVAQCLGAHATDGARTGNAGTWGDAAAMSFYPTKTLGAAGDAGALAFRNPEHAGKARLLRNHGYDDGLHRCLGHNSRMDELQACLLNAAMDGFAQHIARRREIAARYLSAWADLPLHLPPATTGHAWNYFVVGLGSSDERASFATRLAGAGVANRVYYEQPLHHHEALRPWHGGVSLPHAERLAACSIALPLYPTLGDDEVEYVIDAVRQAVLDPAS
ncbi:DegT/DnrJ/EryC1/StrS family aminotransferase [Variovorax sp. CAN2819]|uniref:DegT/DnrJ/EryC1/StrS family aminotransferase n=1 Tax=Variovorax sp. CAN15 TaxID=3046727 RepID=UPI00264A1508|nr:DegT/DnrJ/EryC1/StrS family aminotransferase [Variovorax sp. CAN15]MDN6884515.1 DegT/DnrJ/EryC1/StrS family aminotransferase [Variovorax sp. CAN15]